jgi:hypothetical protein
MIGKTTKAPTSTAERMRLYRKRRGQGLQFVRIPLHVTEIDKLLRSGLLKEEQRQEQEALRAAVLSLVRLALDDDSWWWWPAPARSQ